MQAQPEVRYASVPVVSGAGVSVATAEHPVVNPVVVGVDRSDESALALRQALTLARDLGRPSRPVLVASSMVDRPGSLA
jgi:hypothetical protein